MIKVLIISRTPWDNANSFGNTFSNLFENVDGLEIYNVCCQHGNFNNSVVKKAVQITDKAVFKSVFNKKDPAWIMVSSDSSNKNNVVLSQNATKKRTTFAFVVRDLIWKLGSWKKSKTLNSFLEEIKPDVVYLPIYASPYMCDVQNYLINKLNVSVVGHISDDVYGFDPSATLLQTAYRKTIRKKVKTIIKKCSYLEVFAENMQKEYAKEFNVPCYLIGKGVDVSNLKKANYEYCNNDNLHFVYTGNIGAERYKALAQFGSALDKVYKNSVLDIYSATVLTDDIKKAFSDIKSIKFHGAISREEVDVVQSKADYLIHVESFSKEGVFSAKMSFSTKIIDYMLIGKPIIAIGPNEVNSIQVLKNHGTAIVCENENEIVPKLIALKENKISLEDIATNVYKYLVEYRDIKKIQQGIKQRLKSLVK